MISAMVPESASNLSGAVVQVPHICLCREEKGVGDNPLHPPYRPKMVPSSHWLYSVTTVPRKRATAGVEERRTYCRRVAGGGWSPPPPTPLFAKGLTDGDRRTSEKKPVFILFFEIFFRAGALCLTSSQVHILLVGVPLERLAASRTSLARMGTTTLPDKTQTAVCFFPPRSSFSTPTGLSLPPPAAPSATVRRPPLCLSSSLFPCPSTLVAVTGPPPWPTTHPPPSGGVGRLPPTPQAAAMSPLPPPPLPLPSASLPPPLTPHRDLSPC